MQLMEYLITLSQKLRERAVLFPTRDDDLAFLDRYREQLGVAYSIVIPSAEALRVCLDKWETFGAALQAGVPSPRCWSVRNSAEIEQAALEIVFPCVLKPLIANHWRQGANWEVVGARKAIGVESAAKLLSEYEIIERADARALIQEMIPGDDQCLSIVCCYLTREGKWAAAFHTQKVIQSPPIFGTGCVVRTVDRPELVEPTRRLLGQIGFTGIAEVEYKWDAVAKSFKLIEINARPWDQHRLGNACGVDLMYIAYCDHAGLETPALQPNPVGHKWIAEDAFFTEAVRMAWRRDARLREMLRSIRGKRIYAIWSWRDPVPFLVYVVGRYIPGLAAACFRAFRSRCSVWRRRHQVAAAKPTAL
jgi:predicted ATP-grasp superfamily ATP-dependent carboligase